MDTTTALDPVLQTAREHAVDVDLYAVSTGYFRDARAGHVMAPTADVLYDFYGAAICGLPLFES